MSRPPIDNTIRRLRFDHDEMTQQQLAERIGVTRQTVNAIERGKYSPSLEVAFRVAALFGVPLEQVFEYHGGGRGHGNDDQKKGDRSRPGYASPTRSSCTMAPGARGRTISVGAHT
ncbi:MAG: helix-turn-helix transcriptional regulator [Acidobacteria bacterium]|nr:helix-turn-helix transcriptional regulator [Acidobacteriota bacterium]